MLRLRVPLKLSVPADWHDVVARFRGPNLELFVDGVLVDEEWPHGGAARVPRAVPDRGGYESGNAESRLPRRRSITWPSGTGP